MLLAFALLAVAGCGKKTEVYSRITGYYRPVQNWNDGKAQEFKDRKTYVPETSVLRREALKVSEAAPQPEAVPVRNDQKLVLFSRLTCPNCKVAESLLNKAGVAYEKLIADEHKDLCLQYGIKGAPTLAALGEDGAVTYYGVPEIKKFLAKMQ